MKRVVVIGAGVGGLTAIKSCLEDELQVVCFELTSYVGGLWRFRDEVDEDTVSVFKSVVLNGSKETMAFSDFPPPEEFPTYPRHYDWYKYLESYCEHFGLRKYVRFNHKVLEVVKSEDYESTGKWKVTVCDIFNGNKVVTYYFDFVMVCSGHHVYPIMPQLPGQATFEGKVLHSKEYKRPDIFRDEKVLVIGFGNSAVDIANDLCSSTRQVYLSTRRKGWIIPRLLEGKKITADELYRRSFQFRNKFFPVSWLLAKYENMLNKVFSHDFFGLKPKHGVASQRPVVNDFLPINLLSGGVRLKKGIKEFKKDGVIFEGEDEITEVDSVVFATGFQPYFPFLKGMENVDAFMDQMYKLVFPANLQQNSLAIIGMIDPNLSILICSELQSRWVTRIFSGKIHLPSKLVMLDEASRVQNYLNKITYEGFTQKTYTDGPAYLDNLASMLGVKPNLFKVFVTDPKLFGGIFFGPLVAYQYRVQGPHAWAGAREAILGAEERETFLLRQNRKEDPNKGISKTKFIVISVGVLLGGGLLWRVMDRKPEILHNLLVKFSWNL